MRVYLDVCCLSRPFDGLEQERIVKEAEAVLEIVDQCANGSMTLLVSSLIHTEPDRTKDDERKKGIYRFIPTTAEYILATNIVEVKTENYYKQDLSRYDALHIAFAEVGNADLFLTVDDRIIKKSKILNINMVIENPWIWQKEGKYERAHKRELQ
jgi:hypothetical protein